MSISTKNAMIFKVLLNVFHPVISPKMLKSLPVDESECILAQTITSIEPNAIFKWPSELIMRTHYSWLVPVLKTVPCYLQSPMIKALPEPQSSKLMNLFSLPSCSNELATPMKNFLLNRFIDYWHPLEMLPLAYIPISPLKPLLTLSKNDLVELISYLALQDIANSIRLVVDKKLIKNIYECLSGKHQEYLRICLHQKSKIKLSNVQLNLWDGKRESFDNLLQRLGMFRLSKAISGQSPSFLWLVTHILDTGRGAIVEKFYQSQEILGVTGYLTQQVLFLLNFLNLKGDIKS